MSYVGEVINKLGEQPLLDDARSSNDKIVTRVGDSLGSPSQTLQGGGPAFDRVRRANKRAHNLIMERAGDNRS